jgi:DNA topoisomerase-2
LDHRLEEIPYADFINKELILFSMADNIRSIPSVADGLKPGQRKVMWGCYKRNMKTELKVRRLCGFSFSLTLIVFRSLNLLVTSESTQHTTTANRVWR